MEESKDDEFLMQVRTLGDSPSSHNDAGVFYQLMNLISPVSVLETRVLDEISKNVLYDVGFRRESDGKYRRYQATNTKGVLRFAEFWNNDVLRKKKLSSQTASIDTALTTVTAMFVAAMGTSIFHYLANRTLSKKLDEKTERLTALNKKRLDEAKHLASMGKNTNELLSQGLRTETEQKESLGKIYDDALKRVTTQQRKNSEGTSLIQSNAAQIKKRLLDAETKVKRLEATNTFLERQIEQMREQEHDHDNRANSM